MTFVNWPDKELRPVADSISFGTDNIGSNIQWNRKKSVPNWSASGHTDAFPYQNFSVKARCNLLARFLKSWPMSARIKVFHFGYNVFKLQTFLFLVNVQSWDTCGREARTRTNFWVDKGKWIAVDGALKRKKRLLSLFNVQSIKMKYVSNYRLQRCDIYAPIPSFCNQSIPIDINLSIDCYWKSIPIDNHTNLSHWWVIDYPYQLINWYRLVSIIKFIDWIPWDSTTHDIICAKNTRWLQSAGICNETNTQKKILLAL